MEISIALFLIGLLFQIHYYNESSRQLKYLFSKQNIISEHRHEMLIANAEMIRIHATIKNAMSSYKTIRHTSVWNESSKREFLRLSSKAKESHSRFNKLWKDGVKNKKFKGEMWKCLRKWELDAENRYLHANGLELEYLKQ